MKKLLLSALISLLALSGQAQFNYTFSHYTQAYSPLTTGTSVNDTTRWDEESYKMPIGFTFNMDSKLIDSLTFLWGGLMIASDSLDTINAFVPFAADLIDRGYYTDTVSHSPIRYLVSGTTPNRIFKMEVFNAGFWDEYDLYSTTDDSISYQVWLYETSNIVEMHYGDHRVTNYADYLYNDSLVVNIGYMHTMDLFGSYLDMFYYLDGTYNNPVISSTNDVNDPINEGLDSIPASGTVYRFTPVPVSVKDVNKVFASAKVYPTICQAHINVEQSEKGTASYDIISMTGANINKKGTLQNGKNTIEVGDLPAGAYTIILRNDRGNRSVRFIKM